MQDVSLTWRTLSHALLIHESSWDCLIVQQGVNVANAATKAANFAAEANLHGHEVHALRAPRNRPLEHTTPDYESRPILEMLEEDTEHKELRQTVLTVTQAATEDQLEEAYAYYLALAREQSSLVGSNVVIDSLLAIFQTCNQVSRIAIAPRAARSLLVGKHFRKAMAGPWICDYYDEDEITMGSKDRTIGGHLFAALLATLQSARETSIAPPNTTAMTLRHLDVGELPYKVFQVFKSPDSRELLSTILNSLQSLTMVVNGLWDSDPFMEEEYIPKQHELQDVDWEVHPAGYPIKPSLPRNLPKSAPRLLQLSIAGDYTTICLQEVIAPSYTWPTLSKLHLAELNCGDEDLVGLVQRHRNTLVELRLTNMDTHDASWSHIFRAIAMGISPVLESVILRGLFYTQTTGMKYDFVREGKQENEFTRKVQQCIRERGEEMPESLPELEEWFRLQAENDGANDG